MHSSSRVDLLIRRASAALLAFSLLANTSCVGFGVSPAKTASASTNYADAWLRGTPLDAATAEKYSSLPTVVAIDGDSQLLHTAQSEVIRTLSRILGRPFAAADGGPARGPSILITTIG